MFCLDVLSCPALPGLVATSASWATSRPTLAGSTPSWSRCELFHHTRGIPPEGAVFYLSPCGCGCAVSLASFVQRLEANRKTRADAFYQKKKEAAKLLAAAAKVVDGTA